jgi:non-ribosomal peptide synthetase component E (peptide arylation enzyme)
VVARRGVDGASEGEVRITAYLSVRGERRPSVIELKQFSVDRLPRYMVPDQFNFVDALPRTSTDKIDYQRLTQETLTPAATPIQAPLPTLTQS